MAKTFDIYFSVRIKGEDFNDVTSKMSDMYQNIQNSINNEATLKFTDIDFYEVVLSTICDLQWWISKALMILHCVIKSLNKSKTANLTTNIK